MKLSPDKPPLVLLVDDDEKTLHLVSVYLEREGYAVAIATNGYDALSLARSLLPSLIVLDLMLPGLTGIEVCEILRSETNPFIIMLTARTTEQDKLLGLDAGADDYVSKPFSPRELTARVRAVLRRMSHTNGEAKDKDIALGDLRLNVAQRHVSVAERVIALTPIEFRLLHILASNAGRVFSREELIERAFGYDYEGLDRTVDAHVKNLRRKIEPDRDQPLYIKTKFGEGYYCEPGSR